MSTLLTKNLNFKAPYNLKDCKQTSISKKGELIKVILVLCHSQKAAGRLAAQVFLSETWDILSINSAIFECSCMSNCHLACAS